MITHGTQEITDLRRGTWQITSMTRGTFAIFGKFYSPYGAAATAALKAQFPTQWPTIRDYGFAHPEIVPYVNENPIRWGNILGVYASNFDNFMSLYTWCEYIENTSYSRIDTGVIYEVGETPRVDIKWMQTNTQTSYSNGILGYYGSDPNTMMFILSVRSNTDGKKRFRYCTTSKEVKIDLDNELNRIYAAKLNTSNGTYFDGALKDETCMSIQTRTLEFPLFCDRPYTYGLDLERFLGRIYECDFFRNGNYIRIYMPCYRKSDGVIGMFDIVNNTFKSNAGSGTFSKGSPISETPS